MSLMVCPSSILIISIMKMIIHVTPPQQPRMIKTKMIKWRSFPMIQIDSVFLQLIFGIVITKILNFKL
ncbi:hypothetical protein U3516DRAFT_895236 [Neocallimastix sp. 'constans']